MPVRSGETTAQLADLLESLTCSQFTVVSKSIPGGYHYRIVAASERWENAPDAPTARGAGQALLMVRAFAAGFTGRLESPEPG